MGFAAFGAPNDGTGGGALLTPDGADGGAVLAPNAGTGGAMTEGRVSTHPVFRLLFDFFPNFVEEDW